MKKFLIKTAAFVALLWVVDAAVGAGCRFLQKRAKGGHTGQLNHIADEMKDEVLVFGSSRAMCHYDPRILADSVGLSCYNCGQEGNGIISCYGQYRLFRDRYVPRVIVCDITPAVDLSGREDNGKYLSWLCCFYDREGIDSIFWDVDAAERWKMCSMMRRYNGKFVQLVSDAYSPRQTDVMGYRPLEGTMACEPGKRAGASSEAFLRDTLKMKYWRRLVADCKARGTRLVFMVSPMYDPDEPASHFGPLRQLAREEGIPFLSHYGDTAFTGKRRYFHDGRHLNKEGAEAYTKVVAAELKGLLKNGS